VALLVLVLSAAVPGVRAQQDTLSGIVWLDGDPMTDVTVLLHAVSSSEAGEVDSIRVDAEGRFRFSLPEPLDDIQRNQIYFASVRHLGVLYFGEAIATREQLDIPYLIETFDTIRAPAEGTNLPISVRNVVLDEAEDGSWFVTDLIQLQNSRGRTIVAGDGVVWSHVLPPTASNVRVGQGDLSSDAIEVRDGRVVVLAPIPPGERIVLIRYTIEELPAELPVEAFTDRFDVLVQEPASLIEARPLSSLGPVAVEETTYRLFSGQGLGPSTVTLDAVDEPDELPVGWLAVIFALVLTGAGLWVYYRPTATPAPVAGPAAPIPGTTAMPSDTQLPSGGVANRRRLILDVALIDEELAGGVAPDRESELKARRSELMDRLRAAD